MKPVRLWENENDQNWTRGQKNKNKIEKRSKREGVAANWNEKKIIVVKTIKLYTWKSRRDQELVTIKVDLQKGGIIHKKVAWNKTIKGTVAKNSCFLNFWYTDFLMFNISLTQKKEMLSFQESG